MANVKALAKCWGLSLLYFSHPVGLYMLFITEPYFATIGVVTALLRPFTFTACLSKHSLIAYMKGAKSGLQILVSLCTSNDVRNYLAYTSIWLNLSFFHAKLRFQSSFRVIR